MCHLAAPDVTDVTARKSVYDGHGFPWYHLRLGRGRNHWSPVKLCQLATRQTYRVRTPLGPIIPVERNSKSHSRHAVGHLVDERRLGRTSYAWGVVGDPVASGTRTASIHQVPLATTSQNARRMSTMVTMDGRLPKTTRLDRRRQATPSHFRSCRLRALCRRNSLPSRGPSEDDNTFRFCRLRRFFEGDKIPRRRQPQKYPLSSSESVLICKDLQQHPVRRRQVQSV